MPQAIAAIVAGAALYVGMRWLGAMLEAQRRATEQMAQELKRAAERRSGHASGNAPKDMGVLEYDEEAGAYRPKQSGPPRQGCMSIVGRGAFQRMTGP